MKLILGIIAFTLTFGLSTTLVGLVFGFPKTASSPQIQRSHSHSVTARRINSLLIRDDRNGRIRNRQLANMLKQNVNNLSDSDLYANSAYRNQIASYAARSARINDGGLPRDFQYAWREHMKAWKKHSYSNNSREITQTWHQVLRIARRYGVNINRFPR